jgi:hypothetical protein
MIPLPLLLLVTLPATESPAPAADPISAIMREMPMPNWQQMPPPRDPTQPERSYMQGLLGVTEIHIKELDIGFGPGQWESSDDATMPLIGGAVQRMLGGEKLRFGLEGGFFFGWMGNVETVVIGSGSVAVAADNDIFMTEGFGGVCADFPIGDKLRIYAGAGGLLDWAIVDATYSDPSFGYISASGSGFGWGVYTRAGFDILLQSGMRLGFCWRWFDTDLDMGGGIDDLQLDGMQYMLTFSKSM